MHRYRSRHNGFTMIELITTMVILGLVGAIGAIGFSDAIRGYALTADNAELAQEAQVVMTKLNVELMHMNATVGTPTSTSITYQPVFGLPASATTHTFAYDNNGTLTWDGEPLVDDVLDFSFTYFADHNSTTTTTDPTGTSVIEVSLTLENAVGGNQTFTQRIFPLISNVVPQS